MMFAQTGKMFCTRTERGVEAPRMPQSKRVGSSSHWEWLKEFKHPTTGVALKTKHWPEYVKKCKDTNLYLERTYPEYEPCTDTFMDIVKWLVNESHFREMRFFTLFARAYQWWCQEQGHLTDHDEGEDFEK